MSNSFLKHGEPTIFGNELLAWWRDLERDHASRANLRRAESPTAVALTAAYQRLYRRLVEKGWPNDAAKRNDDRLPAIAGLVARIKEDDAGNVPQAMSRSRKNETEPLVRELRFRRLLDSPDDDALYLGLRRVLPLLDAKINVLALADDFLHWGSSVKRQWAYGYRWPTRKSE